MSKPNWDTTIVVTEIGQFGHNANTDVFRYSGAKGSWPNYTYRFTRFGPSSIAANKFLDIEITSDLFYEGCRIDSRHKIDKIIMFNNDTDR